MDEMYAHSVDLANTYLGLGLNANSILTQMIVYYLIHVVGGVALYLATASLSFFFFFVLQGDKFYPYNVKGGKNEPWIPHDKLSSQIRNEMWLAVTSIPLMGVCMLPYPILSHRGYSRIYRNVDDYGIGYLLFSIPLFLFITDTMIYFIHRGLHYGVFYKYIHKPHHNYRYTTPFSSHAFHPLDGFAQGVPYYWFIFVFPIHSYLFVAMFMVVNCWTVLIHDQVDFGFLSSIVNSTDHHTIHHTDFKFNYGQYFTMWDKLCGSYRLSHQTHTLAGERIRGKKE